MSIREKRPCELCEKWDYLDRHHIFEGSLRKKSEKYNCVINICRECHDKIHRHPLDYLQIKRESQKELMEQMHWTMDDWHREFGKNYLEE